jgi:hypothetical protein
MDDSSCPLCGLALETIGHILWSCPSPKDVWTECTRKIHKCTSDENDFLNIMDKLLDKLDMEELHFIATVARQIWIRRNKFIFKSFAIQL